MSLVVNDKQVVTEDTPDVLLEDMNWRRSHCP